MRLLKLSTRPQRLLDPVVGGSFQLYNHDASEVSNTSTVMAATSPAFTCPYSTIHALLSIF